MKCVCLLSGGIDSSTMMYHLRDNELYPIAINYAQRHIKELGAAMKVSQALGLKLECVNLEAPVIFKGSALTDNIEVPEGHYQAENMRATVVPNRNMILLALATAYAVSIKANFVAYAAHAGDHYIYPDCRPLFADAMREAIKQATGIHLLTPFINMTKAQIVDLGISLQVPYNLTWSCYKGRNKACGKCGTCVERLEAFALNHIKDPIEYEP